MIYIIVHGLIDIHPVFLNLSVTVGRTRMIGISFTFPILHANIIYHSFSYSAGEMWNALPMHVVTAPSLHIFEELLSHMSKRL